MTFPRLLPCTLLLVFFFCKAHASSFAREFEKQCILPLVENTPGAALVVVENGRVALESVYGVKDKERGAPVTPATLFQLASLSKSFASAAAAILVEDTPINWDTPVLSRVSHLKFKEPAYGSAINLEHLLSQSTGLMPHAYTNLIEEPMSYEGILKQLHRVDFICAPGRCYSYQNLVFSLVGDLVETTVQQDYPTFVDARLFKPLRMDRASFGLQAFVGDADHANPHVRAGNEWVAVKPTEHYYKVPPAAGANASISDMREWLLAQLGHRPGVLSQDMLARLHQGVIRTSRRQAHYLPRQALGKVHYGLGWRVFDYADETGFVHHGGYVRGMRSEMVFNPSAQVGMVLLTNSEARGMKNVIFDFLDLRREVDRRMTPSS